MNSVAVDKPINRRRIISILTVVILVLGCLSVKRIVNGNGDLSGNYAVWRANLQAPIQPGRHQISELRLQDPDPYPPITYAIFAPLALLPLWLLAVLWFSVNIACTAYLWNSLAGFLDELQSDTSASGRSEAVSRNPPPEDALSLAPQNATQNATQNAPVSFGSFRLLGDIDILKEVSRFCNGLTNSRILALAGLAVLPSWVGALLIGQNTLIVMTLVTAAYRTNVRRWGWLGCLTAGAMLALAMAMKVLPVVFLLPYFVRRQVRSLAGFAICGCVLLFGIGSGRSLQRRAGATPRYGCLLREHAIWSVGGCDGPVASIVDTLTGFSGTCTTGHGILSSRPPSRRCAKA